MRQVSLPHRRTGVSEGVSKAYASDNETTPRGPRGEDAKIDHWYSDAYLTLEAAYKAQREEGVRRVYPAVVFKVSTAKRRGHPRYCAIPIEPTMEPWAARAYLSK